jgi:hypothetical protein
MKPEPKDVIRALNKAAKMIRDGDVIYICTALDHVRKYHPELAPAALYCCKWVDSMLGKGHTLEMWLNANCEDYREAVSSISMLPSRSPQLLRATQRRYDKVQRTRLAWIAWMKSEIKTNP